MKVTVGGSAGLVFSPNSLQAAVGDMVQFNFESTNHSLTQSTFPLPCVAMAGGADSGFLPNPNNTVNPPPSFMIQVTSTSPTCKLSDRVRFRFVDDADATWFCRVLLQTKGPLW